jgi:hypothetical protein
MTVTPPPPPTGTFTPPQGSYTPPSGVPPAPPPQKSGCLKWVAIGCSIILVLGCAALIALFVFVFSVIKRSDVYREALSRSTSDPRVIEVLGTPIEQGWWVTGNVNLQNNTGNANIDFPISGPKGKAQVHAVATRENDAWTYSAITVKPDVGAEIDVLHP